MEHTYLGKILLLHPKKQTSQQGTQTKSSVNVLDNIGHFAGRHIMTVTRHKAEKN